MGQFLIFQQIRKVGKKEVNFIFLIRIFLKWLTKVRACGGKIDQRL